MTATTRPTIHGGLAAVLDLKGFRPTRTAPNTIWTRGRRASGRRAVAVLNEDGTLHLYLPSRRHPTTETVDNPANLSAVAAAIRRLLRP
jgi:hypothetical protein